MARSHFSFEKRRKELDKKKKKEAKAQAKAERKAAEEAGVVFAEPVVMIDEFGNVVEVVPEEAAAENDSDDDGDDSKPDPA